MGRATEKEVVDSAQPAGQEREPPGHVEFDSRGNSVWRWAKDVIESTSVLLKRLEVKDLALEPTQKVPVMRGADKGKPGQKQSSSDEGSQRSDQSDKSRHPAARRDPRDGGGGFDPYNSR